MIRPFSDPDVESLFEEPLQKKQRPVTVSIATENPRELLPLVLKITVPAFLGLILIAFGLTTTGSYYVAATRFGGILATIWYSWQLGTFLAILGGILIYDAIKRTGYL
jgi:hypothetical protein